MNITLPPVRAAARDVLFGIGILLSFVSWTQPTLAQSTSPGSLPRCSDRFHQSSSASAPAASICREWRERGPVLERFPEGTAVPNPFRLQNPRAGDETQLRRMGTVSPRQRADVNTAFEEMKALLAERIRGGTAPANLNERQRHLLRRLESTRLLIRGDDTQICPRPTSLDARHKPAANLVVMCPALANLPLEAIYETIAHELGHVVDSCNDHSYFPFTERVRTASQRGQTEPLLRECIPNREERLEMARYLESPSRREARGVVVMTPQLAAAQDRLDQLRRCRLVENTGYETPGGQEPSPFAAIERCARRNFPNSRGLAQVDFGSKPGVPDGKPAGPPGDPQCHSQVQECFADHLGADLLNSYLQTHPHRIRPGREHLLMFQGAAINCIEDLHNEAEYPPSHQRLAAFLQFERIQRASGCSGPNATPICPLGETPAGSRSPEGTSRHRSER
jgi:hypothetical protein